MLNFITFDLTITIPINFFDKVMSFIIFCGPKKKGFICVLSAVLILFFTFCHGNVFYALLNFFFELHKYFLFRLLVIFPKVTICVINLFVPRKIAAKEEHILSMCLRKKLILFFFTIKVTTKKMLISEKKKTSLDSF